MLILCILDGWGYSQNVQHNAIFAAHTPNFDMLFKSMPHSLIDTSGKAAGLPDGQFGNSEVGHMTIGAGRVIKQDLVRISESFENGSIMFNPMFQNLLANCKGGSNRCHLVALISDGGVHSYIDHIVACASILKDSGINVLLHAITDGRDTSPKSALRYIQKLIDNNIEISTISGRYFAMDRDMRLDRTERYFGAMLGKVDAHFKDPIEYMEHCYANSLYDEFIPPAILRGYKGICDDDALFMANFRPDRMRQIAKMLADTRNPSFRYMTSMTQYSNELAEYINPMFLRESVQNTLGEVIARAGKRQIRIAETEKYAHVTYFLNCGREKEYNNEDRVLIPSPKVATYDLAPQMSAVQVKDAVVENIQKNYYDFICVNFANADMVGHTGNFEATKIACETIDSCIGEIMQAAQKYGAHLLITADHGNAEEMFDKTSNQRHTAHTMNKVPLIYFGNYNKSLAEAIGEEGMVGVETRKEGVYSNMHMTFSIDAMHQASSEIELCKKSNIALKDGELKDIAPTVLQFMGIDTPSGMTGKSLIVSANK